MLDRDLDAYCSPLLITGTTCNNMQQPSGNTKDAEDDATAVGDEDDDEDDDHDEHDSAGIFAGAISRPHQTY